MPIDLYSVLHELMEKRMRPGVSLGRNGSFFKDDRASRIKRRNIGFTRG